MSLSCEKCKPELKLSSGCHAGFDWVVMNNGMANRCGYARIPVGHPWHGIDGEKIDADVHGGLTFAGADTGGLDDGWWVGFDCAHSGDAADPALKGYRGRAFPVQGGTVRSQEYVESVCRSLCEQARDAVSFSEGRVYVNEDWEWKLCRCKVEVATIHEEHLASEIATSLNAIGPLREACEATLAYHEGLVDPEGSLYEAMVEKAMAALALANSKDE